MLVARSSTPLAPAAATPKPAKGTIGRIRSMALSAAGTPNKAAPLRRHTHTFTLVYLRSVCGRCLRGRNTKLKFRAGIALERTKRQNGRDVHPLPLIAHFAARKANDVNPIVLRFRTRTNYILGRAPDVASNGVYRLRAVPRVERTVFCWAKALAEVYILR
jgi:hypothetical protein